MSGLQLKNYGVRTMVGNWYEERIMLDKYSRGYLQVKDMTLEKHVKPNESTPKWEMDFPSVTTSQYQEDTDIRRLEERGDLQRRVQRLEARRRLQGTGLIAAEAIPGSTCTQHLLPTQFIDPNKTRHKTEYQRAYCGPDTTQRLQSPRRMSPRRAVTPRIGITTGHWRP